MTSEGTIAEHPGTDSDRVFIDMSDMLMYLHHHSVVSGIQRVIAEVLPHLQQSNRCEFVAFSQRRGVFVQLHRGRVLEMLGLVRGGDGAARAKVQSRVDAIADTIEARPPLAGHPGDVLAVLGAGWVYSGLFRSVHRLKEDGVAVVVLMYDLIPVVYPGFAEAMIHQFRQYLPRVAWLADRAPGISEATRRDFERYCTARNWAPPSGAATRLAGDQWEPGRLRSLGVADTPAWPRPFVLFVATIEARKNHILALRCWQQLLAEHGPEAVPDLVCVGRLGWNVFEFLEEFEVSEGLGGRMHLLMESVPDAQLAALYRDCLFTVYPSRYEGWGLPIGESLDWGKPVVASRSSSLPEVGGDFVAYFDDNDLDGFHRAVDRYVFDPAALASDAERIRRDYHPPSWREVADVLTAEFGAARLVQQPFRVAVGLGVEYGLKPLRGYDGNLEGGPFLRFLEAERRLPLTGQLLGVERSIEAELLVDQEFGTADRVDSVRIDIRRATAEELVLVVATTEGRGEAEVLVTGPKGTMTKRLIRGEAILVELGTGVTGAHAPVTIVPRSGWGGDGPVLSFVVVDSLQAAESLVYRNLARLAGQFRTTDQPGLMSDSGAAAALEAVTSSLSWRITKPLRDGKRLVRRRQSRRRL